MLISCRRFDVPCNPCPPFGKCIRPSVRHISTLLNLITNVILFILATKLCILRLTTHLDERKSARPIEQLPVEVLGEIFLHCLPDLTSFPTPRIRDAPMLLCRVCRHWREVAGSMPILWARFSADPNVKHSGYSFMMDLWLDRPRSSTTPLSLDLWAPPATRHQLIFAFPQFLRHIHRWYNVVLDLHKGNVDMFLAAHPGPGPLLEKLKLFTGDCTPEQEDQVSIALNRFTSLRHLVYRDLPDTASLPLASFQWSMLTSIHLSCYLTLDQCVKTLAKCTHVQELDITSLHGPSIPIILPNSILLQYLTRMTLRTFCDVGDLFAQLTCPALCDLTIFQTPPDDSRDYLPFEAFLARSSCSLRSLNITDNPDTEDGWTGCLSAPSLQSLIILILDSPSIGGQTLAALTCSNDNGSKPFLPSLEKLELLGCSSGCAPDGHFAKMVASRIQLTPLRTIHVKFRYVYPTTGQPCWEYKDQQAAVHAAHACDFAQFQGFCDEGLQITWGIEDD